MKALRTMKKVLCLLLTLCFLLPMALACGKDGEATDSGVTDAASEPVAETPVSEGAISGEALEKLVIVRPSGMEDESLLSAINLLKRELKNVFGVTAKIMTENGNVEDGSVMILIGATTKKQSTEALAKLSGFGYVLGNYDGHVVINARNDHYLLQALNRFIGDYVSAGKEYIALPKDLIVEETEAYVLSENGQHTYGIVYTSAFEEAVTLLNNKINAYTGAKLPNTSKLPAAAAEYEVLIGDTARPESAEALKLIDYDEAVITVINKKLVVRGWYENTTKIAIDKLMEVIENFYDINGKCIFIPADYKLIIGEENDFILDIPTYDGGEITCAADVGQNNFLMYVDGTNEQEYRAYCAKLEKDGYTLYMKNDELNSVKSATYKSSSTMIHVYYIANENAVRIVTAPMSSTTLPPTVSEPTVDKVTDSSVTQVILDYYDYRNKDDGNFGNCYVIRLDDGSLLIYDGGNKYSDADVERLWNVMNKQAIRKSGKIVVAGWIISHEHGDHIYGMYYVLKKYGSQIKLENVYSNKVTEEVAEMGGGRTDFVDAPMMREVYTSVGGFDSVRVHTGQTFWIRNAKVEVLYTPEDMYPDGIKNYEKYADFNDTSVVTRLTIDGTTYMNLGDSYAVASNTLVATYGDELKSDMSTIAHHGWGGGSKELYKCIDADRYFMPFSQKAFDAITGENLGYIQWAVTRYNAYNYPFYQVLQQIVADVGVKNVLVADHFNKEVVFKDKSLIVHEDFNEQYNYSSFYNKADYRYING